MLKYSLLTVCLKLTPKGKHFLFFCLSHLK